MNLKFDKEKFDEFYKGLTDQARKKVRDEFLAATGLSYPSWFTKRSKGVFSPLEIKELKRITNIDFSTKAE